MGEVPLGEFSIPEVLLINEIVTVPLAGLPIASCAFVTDRLKGEPAVTGFVSAVNVKLAIWPDITLITLVVTIIPVCTVSLTLIV